MKTYSILFTLFFLTLAGCTSTIPIDDETRNFLAESPESVSHVKTTVQTKSGRDVTFEAGSARFDSSNSQTFLARGKDNHANHSNPDNADTHYTVPASEIQSINMDYDIKVMTRDEWQLQADAGAWRFLKSADSGFAWTANHAKKWKIKHMTEIAQDNTPYKTTTKEYAGIADTAITSKNIKDMQLIYTDNLKTIFLFLGCIAAAFIIIGRIDISLISSKISNDEMQLNC